MEDGLKISELGETSSVTGTDIIPIVSSNETKQATISQVANYSNNIIAPKYCIATSTTSPNVTSNYYVPLNQLLRNFGNFTLEDNGIKIPQGISHIKVSGSIFLDNFPGGTNYLWAKIYRKRGNTEDMISGVINNTATTILCSSIPPQSIDVQEGDIIKLMADSSTSSAKIRGYSANTWLYVEKLD